MNDTPLPCPFCGEPGNVYLDTFINEWFAGCTNIEGIQGAACPACPDVGPLPTREEALAAWNYRPGLDELDRLQDEVGAWGVATFPHATRESIIAHLRRELDELERAETPAQRAEEGADCYLLLLHLAHRDVYDLRGEAARKLEVNRGRTWGAPDAEGVSEHVRPS
jgi:ssDNA-binding Zn-finger/Zn-ribbon topoisomerase 1